MHLQHAHDEYTSELLCIAKDHDLGQELYQLHTESVALIWPTLLGCAGLLRKSLIPALGISMHPPQGPQPTAIKTTSS